MKKTNTIIIIIIVLSITFIIGCEKTIDIQTSSSEELGYISSNLTYADNIGGYGENTVVSVKHNFAGIGLSDLRLYNCYGDYKTIAKLIAEPMRIQIYEDKIYYQSSIFNGVAGDLYVCKNTLFPKRVIKANIQMYLVCGNKIIYTYSVLESDNIKLAIHNIDKKTRSVVCENVARVFTVNEDKLVYYNKERRAFVLYSLKTLELLTEIPFEIDSNYKLYNIVIENDDIFAVIGDGYSDILYDIQIDETETKLLYIGDIYKMWRINEKVYCYSYGTIIVIEDNSNQKVVYESTDLNSSIYYNGEYFVFLKKDDEKTSICAVDLTGSEFILFDIN